jgi:hypothetical protein
MSLYKAQYLTQPEPILPNGSWDTDDFEILRVTSRSLVHKKMAILLCGGFLNIRL